MAIIVPVYSEQALTVDAERIINEVLKDYPPNTFQFEDVTQEMQGQPPYSVSRFGSPCRVLVFGSGSKFGVKFGYPWELIHTYSIAQLVTKANAVSVLKAALNQFYLPQKPRPKTLTNARGLSDFDLARPIAMDIETDGDLDTAGPENVGILSISFYQDDKVCVWDLRDTAGMGVHQVLNPAHVKFFELIRCWLRLIQKPIWHNGKFDIRVIEAAAGIRMPNYFDTMLAHHVLNQAAGNHKLKDLCKLYFGAPEWEADLKKYLKKGAHYELVPPSILNEYNGWDVYWTWELYLYLEPLILADEELSAAFMLEMAAGDFLLEVEQFGFKFDVAEAKKLEGEMLREKSLILQGIQILTGDLKFNPNSPIQVKKFLASVGVNVRSTDEAHMHELMKKSSPGRTEHDFAKKLLEYRKVTKALSTYVVGGLNAVRSDGRVHTTFKIHGTSTGRLSSSGPNIQNIPRDKKYRNLYIG